MQKHRATKTGSALVAAILLASVALSAPACGGAPRIVPLSRVAGAYVLPPPPVAAPLEVVTRSTAIADPLPVRGSDVVYGDVESVLGAAVASAAGPWAEAHHGDPVAQRGGWSVLVEITRGDAEIEPGGRVIVRLEVRATLRTRSGNVYLGQTQAGCREGGLVAADDGAPVLYRCMTRIGRDLAGWLSGGVRLEPPPEPG